MTSKLNDLDKKKDYQNAYLFNNFLSFFGGCL